MVRSAPQGTWQPMAARRACWALASARVVAHCGGRRTLRISGIVLLAVLLAQAGTGLFSNDGNFTEGPLARLVSGATGERPKMTTRMTRLPTSWMWMFAFSPSWN